MMKSRRAQLKKVGAVAGVGAVAAAVGVVLTVGSATADPTNDVEQPRLPGWHHHPTRTQSQSSTGQTSQSRASNITIPILPSRFPSTIAIPARTKVGTTVATTVDTTTGSTVRTTLGTTLSPTTVSTTLPDGTIFITSGVVPVTTITEITEATTATVTGTVTQTTTKTLRPGTTVTIPHAVTIPRVVPCFPPSCS
jgi:hypothetical protein